jgi:hypothetical protein
MTERSTGAPSPFKGSLIREKESTPIKGTLLDAIRQTEAKESENTADIELRGTLIETLRRKEDHLPTWKMNFGRHISEFGNFEQDGYWAINSNHSSGQDAFAVNPAMRIFAVADGLGGAGYDYEGTAFLAKYVSDKAAMNGIDIFFDGAKCATILYEMDKEFSRTFGRTLQRPVDNGIKGTLKQTVASTLTYAEVLSANKVRVVTIGDSPVFLLDKTGRVLKQFGEDAITGAPDTPLRDRIAIGGNGEVILPDKTKPYSLIQDFILNLAPEELVMIGSDYFSESQGKICLLLQNHSEADYVLQTNSGRGDDATAIFIDPSRLFPRITDSI